MKKDPVLALRKEQESRRLWESMTLTPVGNLDAIRNSTGSNTDGSTFMMGTSDLVLKREVRSIPRALERLEAIHAA